MLPDMEWGLKIGWDKVKVWLWFFLALLAVYIVFSFLPANLFKMSVKSSALAEKSWNYLQQSKLLPQEKLALDDLKSEDVVWKLVAPDGIESAVSGFDSPIYIEDNAAVSQESCYKPLADLAAYRATGQAARLVEAVKFEQNSHLSIHAQELAETAVQDEKIHPALVCADFLLTLSEVTRDKVYLGFFREMMSYLVENNLSGGKFLKNADNSIQPLGTLLGEDVFNPVSVIVKSYWTDIGQAIKKPFERTDKKTISNPSDHILLIHLLLRDPEFKY